ADRIRCFKIEIRLDHDNLHVPPLHVVDEIECVLRRWRNTGLGFHVTDNIQAKPVGEVWKRPMIRYDFDAFVWCHHCRPSFFSIMQTDREVVHALLKIRTIVRLEFSEPVGNLSGNNLAVFRIETEMPIAERMDVTLCAGDLSLRKLQNAGLQRSIEI